MDEEGTIGERHQMENIDTTNTVLARFLEDKFNMLLKNLLSKSNYTVKNSWEFQKIMVTKHDT